jgi:Uma2 family endonuclease
MLTGVPHLRIPHRRAERMGMPAASPYYSRDRVLALPDDGNRYETVWGELLVTPSPRLRHQRILERLAELVGPWARRQGVGELLRAPADISWGPDILVQPDLFVVAAEQAGARDWSEVTRLVLVVEVLSPSTARADRFAKRRLYQAQGVASYWIVDPDAAAVEVWTPDAVFPVVERERVAWYPDPAADSLVIELAELFR